MHEIELQFFSPNVVDKQETGKKTQTKNKCQTLTYRVEKKIIKEKMCSPGDTIDGTFVDFTKVGKEPTLILVESAF